MFKSNAVLPSGICAKDQLNHCHVAVTLGRRPVAGNAPKAAAVFKTWGPETVPESY